MYYIKSINGNFLCGFDNMVNFPLWSDTQCKCTKSMDDINRWMEQLLKAGIKRTEYFVASCPLN